MTETTDPAAVWDSTITAWNPKADSALGVWSMAVDPANGMLHIGGDFTKINDQPQAHYAHFPPTPPAAP